jgi:Flp pilus assembly protein CpaB
MRRRNGIILLVVGIIFAIGAGFMVMSATRAATIKAETLVQVVVATQDIPEGVAVPAEALTTRNAPPEIVPAGAIAAPDQAVGKYTVTKIFKDQIVMAPQLSAVKVAGKLAASVPAGKVAMAWPASDLMGASRALTAGDRVDILLSLQLPALGATPQDQTQSQTMTLSTQTTVQNVEILSVSWEDQGQTNQGAVSTNVKSDGTITFIVDRQTALMLKAARDSGGVVDVVLRNPEDTKEAATDGITIDSLITQFKFRLPAKVQ